jgi:hypothetical protein
MSKKTSKKTVGVKESVYSVEGNKAYVERTLNESFDFSEIGVLGTMLSEACVGGFSGDVTDAYVAVSLRGKGKLSLELLLSGTRKATQADKAEIEKQDLEFANLALQEDKDELERIFGRNPEMVMNFLQKKVKS